MKTHRQQSVQIWRGKTYAVRCYKCGKDGELHQFNGAWAVIHQVQQIVGPYAIVRQMCTGHGRYYVPANKTGYYGFNYARFKTS